MFGNDQVTDRDTRGAEAVYLQTVRRARAGAEATLLLVRLLARLARG